MGGLFLMKRKFTWLLSLTLVLSVFLAACSGDDKGSKGSDKSAENKDVKQELNLINGDAIPSMDPSKATDEYGFQFLGATMEGLYRLGKDAKVEKGIADSHKVSDDGLTWTFKLRQDAKWSNGDPVTANDFVYAWQRAVNPETGSEYGPYMMGGVIKNATEISKGEKKVEELGVKAEDDHTLVVELANPIAYFESLTTFGTFLPLNQKFVEEKGDKFATSSDTLLSNGPFVLENWKSASQKWNLAKNDTYWDADTVKLEKINFVVVKDNQTMVDLYEKGEVDRAGLSSDYVDQYSSNPDFVTQPDNSVFYFKINQTRNEVLKNKNLRLAISRAFDKEALVNTILNNGSSVANGLVPADFTPMPDGSGDFRKVSGDLVTYDVKAAQEYFEKAKKELGKDTIEVELLGDDSESSTTMNEYLANQLQTNLPGLKVNFKKVPFKQRLALDTAMDYDLQVAGWGPDYLDPYTFLSLWITDGGNNQMGYSNKEYDKLLADTATTLATDNDARYKNFLEAEKLLFEDGAIAPIFQRGRAFLSSPKIQNMIVNPFGPTYEWKWTSVGSGK